MPEAAASEAAAKAHAQVLETFYNHITVTSAVDLNQRGGLRLLVSQMLDCLAKQYSVHEIVWRPDPVNGLSATFYFAPLWFFENTTGSLRFLESEFGLEGRPLEDTGWLVCATDVPLMKACSLCYYLKREAQTDWAVFSQRFGAGFPVLKTSAAQGSDERDKAEAALAEMVQNTGLLIGAQDAVEWLQPGGQGAPFEAFVSRMDRAMAAVWRGSDLGTLSSQDGAGASLQGEESDILDEDDAILIEEALEMAVSRQVIAYYFGSSAMPAATLKFRLPSREQKQSSAQRLREAAEIGCPVSKATAYEMLGLPAPKEGEDVINAPAAAAPMYGTPLANEADPFEAEAQRLLQARGRDAEAIRARVARLESAASPQDYAAALAELSKDLPQLLQGDRYADALLECVLKFYGSQNK